MTTNHTELCERLRTEIEVFRKAGLNPGELVPALAHIEELELEREQAVAEAHGYRDRIAELEKERDAILSKVKSTLVHERSLYLSKWKREAITACIERVDALQAEKETRS